jgi:heme/copper-type cytochrome/quinol oxidase subunit 1
MKLIPIVFIVVMIGIFLTIFPNIFAGFESQHNMTAYSSGLGSNYTPEYEALTELTQTDMVVLAGIGMLMLVGMLYILIKIVL